MTRYEKIAVSLPCRVAENARRAVRDGKAPSLSAYVAQALEERTKQDSLAQLLEEMLAETGGPPTPAERRWARQQLGLSPVRKSRGRRSRR